jgi:Gas vesicle synthesis protein GvpL/GvpF
MLYIYALGDGLNGVADLRGISGERLQFVPVGGAVAVAGEVAELPPLDAQTLKAQDALVRTLHNHSAALLPMRFGTAAPGIERVVEAITARAGIMQRLEAVRGCEQMIVRVAGETSAPPTPPGPGLSDARVVGVEGRAPTGRAYLEARAKAHPSPPELTALASAAGALQRESRIEPARQPGFLGSIYHLIERGRAEEYRAAIEHAAAAHENLRVIITGPLPAYAFA